MMKGYNLREDAHWQAIQEHFFNIVKPSVGKSIMHEHERDELITKVGCLLAGQKLDKQHAEQLAALVVPLLIQAGIYLEKKQFIKRLKEDKIFKMTGGELAEWLHNAYEQIAEQVGWKTQEGTSVK